MIFQKIK